MLGFRCTRPGFATGLDSLKRRALLYKLHLPTSGLIGSFIQATSRYPLSYSVEFLHLQEQEFKLYQFDVRVVVAGRLLSVALPEENR